MTVTGKVQKYKLRELAIEQLGLEDAAAIETAFNLALEACAGASR